MTQYASAPDSGDDARLNEEILRCGDIELLGQLANSSNETFLVEVTHDDEQRWAIYKPELGERPLRDFPPGLHRREVAAYLLSEALGWQLVPPTVLRNEAPLGIGSLQLFVNHDPSDHYFTLLDQQPATHERLRQLVLFDWVANNADRKSGHVLYDTAGQIWGIDHGLCFAAPLKLRTVIWDFAGETIPTGWLDDIAPLAERLPAGLEAELTWVEAAALQERVRDLNTLQKYPEDPTGMRFPWPLV